MSPRQKTSWSALNKLIFWRRQNLLKTHQRGVHCKDLQSCNIVRLTDMTWQSFSTRDWGCLFLQRIQNTPKNFREFLINLPSLAKNKDFLASFCIESWFLRGLNINLMSCKIHQFFHQLLIHWQGTYLLLDGYKLQF